MPKKFDNAADPIDYVHLARTIRVHERLLLQAQRQGMDVSRLSVEATGHSLGRAVSALGAFTMAAGAVGLGVIDYPWAAAAFAVATPYPAYRAFHHDRALTELGMQVRRRVRII